MAVPRARPKAPFLVGTSVLSQVRILGTVLPGKRARSGPCAVSTGPWAEPALLPRDDCHTPATVSLMGAMDENKP